MRHTKRVPIESDPAFWNDPFCRPTLLGLPYLQHFFVIHTAVEETEDIYRLE